MGNVMDLAKDAEITMLAQRLVTLYTDSKWNVTAVCSREGELANIIYC
jgi:hypothetical protein